MKIAIDCRLYGLEHAGIGRYVQNLVDHLSEIDFENDYIFFVKDVSIINKTPKKTTLIETNVRHYSFAEQTTFLHQVNQIEADVFHFPHFNVPILFNKPYVVTIHDLLWHEKIGLNATTLNPIKYVLKYGGYRATIRNAVHKSKAIITPSNYVGRRIQETFKVDSQKIKTTYESVDDVYLKPIKKNSNILKKYKVTKPFIIYTGSLYPHKNVDILVDVISELPEFQLVLASARNIFFDKFQSLVKSKKATKQVKMLGFVPDKDLIQLYQQATCLIQPSKSEGFGLTGLEAMAVGLPVISSQHPVLQEVYGTAAEFADVSSVESIKSAIEKLHTNKKLWNKKSSAGKVQAHTYSWQKMAEETLDVYQKALSI